MTTVKNAKKNYMELLHSVREEKGWHHIKLHQLALLMNLRKILTVHRLYEVEISPPELRVDMGVYHLDRKNDVKACTILKFMDEESVWVGDGMVEWKLFNEQLLYTPIPMKQTLITIDKLDEYIPYPNAAEIWKNEQALRTD